MVVRALAFFEGPFNPKNGSWEELTNKLAVKSLALRCSN